MKKVILCGASGSIGGDTLAILREFPNRFTLVGLSVHTNTTRLTQWIGEFKPARILISDPASRAAWLELNREHEALLLPEDAQAADMPAEDADIVVNGIMGFAGLAVTLAALELDLDVALANKESLVCGGQYLQRKRASSRGLLLPVDSEHSALWQLLQGRPEGSVNRVWLTASGGPFRTWTGSGMRAVTPEQALNHPTWRMGPKITIDSATLINKGLEVIEASLLFDIPADDIGVLVHPTSTAHALVEFSDSSVICQMASPDMRQPILQALCHPDCPESSYGRLDFDGVLNLTFEPLDDERFPAVKLARLALNLGGTTPLAFNAADEVAVEAFLAGELDFPGIVEAVQAVIEMTDWKSEDTFTNLQLADLRAREMTKSWLAKRPIN
ncbi:MAG: 1-deoxy-D-xylulose-5-phosphate reductoisomerase [bacterium]|nr:1-deoxy-D-xylulose-5-phosphate reductoisomerase [bacterium]